LLSITGTREILELEEIFMIQASSTASRLEAFAVHVRTKQYSASVRRHYLSVARQLVDYLARKCISVETVGVTEVEAFLQWEFRRWRRQYGRKPRNSEIWLRRRKSAIKAFLRQVHGHWPIVATPTTAIERFHRDLLEGYDAWMQELRGLTSVTRLTRTTQALHFLTDLGPRGDQESLAQLQVGDIDSYVQRRSKGLRRRTIAGYTVCLRSFLRYLHASGRTAVNLSGTVLGPRIYDSEEIPAALRPEEVQAILEVTREDRSAKGKRDYAFLMLLATYGLRAGEIIALRLEDIDWKKETLRVRHSKTGAESELPLLREAGEAVLKYLKHARPESKQHRELFLQVQEPHRPYRGSILNSVIRARLKRAGITPRGRKGPHAFRHARAVSLLRAGVLLKVIGDLLGHKSEKSTAVYLKLATEDLRAVSLSIPKEVLP
jgi:integrase/recombinase XerD